MILKMKKCTGRCILSILLSSVLLLSFLPAESKAAGLELTSPSAILMDAKTGTVIYEKNSHEKKSPASITKLMTLFIALEYLKEGKITLEDEVVTSEYAMSMGGSQVFLEEGEVQTVETLLKCIVVASGNDASVALAEYIAGSEMLFVEKMNACAGEMGLEDTHFMDCCGLTADPAHYTSAFDIAVLTRNMLNLHPEILDYSGIWMEDMIHHTRRGDHTFTISSTNKLLRTYEYATGLKTGYTSTAKFCVSATARKAGRDLIAVIMGAADSKTRFAEAKELLEYGFNKTVLYEDKEENDYRVPVRFGTCETVMAKPEKEFSCLFDESVRPEMITKEVEIADDINAPAQKGQKAGKIIYKLDLLQIGEVDIIICEDLEEADYGFCLKEILKNCLL